MWLLEGKKVSQQQDFSATYSVCWSLFLHKSSINQKRFAAGVLFSIESRESTLRVAQLIKIQQSGGQFKVSQLWLFICCWAHLKLHIWMWKQMKTCRGVNDSQHQLSIFQALHLIQIPGSCGLPSTPKTHTSHTSPVSSYSPHKTLELGIKRNPPYLFLYHTHELDESNVTPNPIQAFFTFW